AVDPASGQVEIANAGHPPTYLLRSGQVQEIEMPSPPLGTLGHRFPSRRLALEPNDVLLWLSDGLIEAVDRRGEVFGFQRVRATLEAAQLGGPPSPEEAKRALLEAVVSHTADGGSLDDDLTVVVLSWDGHGATPDAD
ncbi:MAG: PP2C family protein-serine/threonine phosphatase, partial [Acidobacteriota bacterium]